MNIPRRALTDTVLEYYGKNRKFHIFQVFYEIYPSQKNEKDEGGIVSLSSNIGSGPLWIAYIE